MFFFSWLWALLVRLGLRARNARVIILGMSSVCLLPGSFCRITPAAHRSRQRGQDDAFVQAETRCRQVVCADAARSGGDLRTPAGFTSEKSPPTRIGPEHASICSGSAMCTSPHATSAVRRPRSRASLHARTRLRVRSAALKESDSFRRPQHGAAFVGRVLWRVRRHCVCRR